MGKLDWYGPQVRAAIAAEMGRRLHRVAILVANRAKELVSGEGTTKSGTGPKAKLSYDTNPSAPGDPPHVQTGRLRGSIAWEVVGLAARVGTNLPYGRFLELGTAKMRARPWLRRALAECQAQIKAILGAPMAGPK